MAIFNLMILEGDGIGPEVVRPVRELIALLERNQFAEFAITDGLFGGCSIDRHGVPVTDETLAQALAADGVLLGAVGGSKWSDVPFDRRPEAGLMRLRQEMGLFANIRPAVVLDCLVANSPLKSELVVGLDLVVVRELSAGVYFGKPHGIEILPNGDKRGINTHSYTSAEIRRVAKVAFELARRRRKGVCSVDKANVMETGALWRHEVTEFHRLEYPDVTLTHMYADNCAMQLVRRPSQFDVILTDNLFGDLLSDEVGMITGSLGLLPSASWSSWHDGKATGALYEPVHGSAPDIAGTGQANPSAAILSLAMLLRYSMGMESLASRIEKALFSTIGNGWRTADLATSQTKVCSTDDFGKAVLAHLNF